MTLIVGINGNWGELLSLCCDQLSDRKGLFGLQLQGTACHSEGGWHLEWLLTVETSIRLLVHIYVAQKAEEEDAHA